MRLTVELSPAGTSSQSPNENVLALVTDAILASLKMRHLMPRRSKSAMRLASVVGHADFEAVQPVLEQTAHAEGEGG